MAAVTHTSTKTDYIVIQNPGFQKKMHKTARSFYVNKKLKKIKFTGQTRNLKIQNGLESKTF